MIRRSVAPGLSRTAIISAVVLSLACAAGEGTNGPTVTAPTVHSFDRVVLISIDGLRGDAFVRGTKLASLTSQAAWTDSMHTVVPSMTVPGHLSMLTGRDVTQFGIRDNTFDSGTGAALVLHGASAIFDWARSGGKHSTAVVGAILIPESSRALAQQFFTLDTLVSAQLDADSVADQAIAMITSGSAANLLFVHFSDVDLTGHDSGWLEPRAAPDTGFVLTTAYVAAVAHVDGAIARLITALQPGLDAGTTALIITADHGGGRGSACVANVPAVRQHCTSDPGDVLTPFALVGQGIRPQRLASGLRITQVAPTIAKLLGVSVPAGVDAAISY